MKDVTFKVSFNGYRLGETKNEKNKVRTKSDVRIFCQHVLGIVPGHFKASKVDRRIKIEGLVIDGNAIHYQHVLRIGDCLQQVNDCDVTWDNIYDTVLSVHSKQIKLTIKSMVPEEKPSSDCLHPGLDEEQFVQLVTGNISSEDHFIYNSFFTVMYLSMQGLTSDKMADKADIVFQFPRQDNKLVDIRGLFITLSQEIQQVSSSSAKGSTLIYEGSLVHICYHQEGSDLFLITAPASRLDNLVLQGMLGEVVRLLQVLHGSLSDVFKNKSSHKQLSHFFSLVHHKVFSVSSLPPSIELDLCSLKKVQYLPLSRQVTSIIDSILSEYEAADFIQMSDSFYGCRRNYTILGSCHFFKNYLLCSHLPNEDLYDLYLYLKHQCLFSVCEEQPIGQLVVWREVFPTRQCYDLEEEQMFGYTEPVDASWYWLIVGLKHSLLGVLLEKGGCTVKKKGISSPDPFLIDQARVTLLHLESLGIPAHCEARMSSDMVPAVARNSEQLSIDSTRRSKMDSLYKGSENKSTESHETMLFSPYGHNRTSLMQSTGSVENATTSNDSIFRESRKGRQFAVRRHPSSVSMTDHSVKKLSAGGDNCMFHYLHTDSGMGIFVSPSWISNCSGMYGPLHQELVQNFYRCSSQLHHLFETDRRKQKLRRDDTLDYGSHQVEKVREQGVMFQYTPQQSPDQKTATFTYWVVGRYIAISPSQEVYVCFQDSTPHNLVQLAFQLNLG
ncbi:hypothetical protein ScPMuIL_011160 [Solemya velum]